jgi:hypothetical protein
MCSLWTRASYEGLIQTLCTVVHHRKRSPVYKYATLVLQQSYRRRLHGSHHRKMVVELGSPQFGIPQCVSVCTYLILPFSTLNW